ncbi:hypothetical protein KM043_003788 [Ampulex compressa]|nr:hypothetical protein KM043_003788 [Ampulex compressa]
MRGRPADEQSLLPTAGRLPHHFQTVSEGISGIDRPVVRRARGAEIPKRVQRIHSASLNDVVFALNSDRSGNVPRVTNGATTGSFLLTTVSVEFCPSKGPLKLMHAKCILQGV